MKLDRWGRLSARIQSVAYRECKGRHYSEMRVTLFFLDGELYGWSDPVLGVSYVQAPAELNLEKLAAARLDIANGEQAAEALDGKDPT